MSQQIKTIGQLRQALEGLSDSTPIAIMEAWGEYYSIDIISIEDLIEGDPARDNFPPDHLVLAPADLGSTPSSLNLEI